MKQRVTILLGCGHSAGPAGWPGGTDSPGSARLLQPISQEQPDGTLHLFSSRTQQGTLRAGFQPLPVIFLGILFGKEYMGCAQSFQLCLTPCDSMDNSPPGPSVHRILQARMLEWVAVPSSRGYYQGSNPCLCLLQCKWILYHGPMGDALEKSMIDPYLWKLKLNI